MSISVESPGDRVTISAWTRGDQLDSSEQVGSLELLLLRHPVIAPVAVTEMAVRY